MNKLSNAKRAQVVAALVEGCSIRATVRMTGVAKNTVTKLLVNLGRACDEYQRRTIVNLKSRRIECDEIWAFVYSKEKNAPADMKAAGTAGDIWTWTAIDAESKLMVTWLVGHRDAGYAHTLIEDLASRVSSRIQLTTDGQKLYFNAVEGVFGIDVDYGVLIKTFGENVETSKRYSPAVCTGCAKEVRMGNPDRKYISTSYVERANLTMRMGMRRFTRLTNAFSKKVENLEAAVALHFMHYNFARVHQTLRVTPAMEAGIADHVWTLAEIVALLD
jgi:IS1 family transposase/lambda repressor-like predicted transcriptional regulator